MRLVICPLHEVQNGLSLWRPSHVVTLASPGAEQAQIPAGPARLSLIFNDIAEPQPGLQAPAAEDVARLMAFARDWPRAQPMMIQCWAGVSRSPAAAYIVACMLSAPGTEARLAWTLRAAAPFATPNPRLVALADQVLNRGGTMVDAIAGIGRGAETSLGQTFALELA